MAKNFSQKEAVKRLVCYFEYHSIELNVLGPDGCHMPEGENLEDLLKAAISDKLDPTPWMEEVTEEVDE